MKKILILLMPVMFQACDNSIKTAITHEEDPVGNVVTLTEAQLKNAAITTVKLEEREVPSILKVNGKIDVPPQNLVSISVPLGGYLKSTKLLPGMHVRKGEVIAVMEDQQYIQLQQDYLTAKARMGALEQEYQRQKDLNESKASSDKIFQQAEADFRSQRVLLSSLAEKLHLAGININQLREDKISGSVNIYSPINGYVSEVDVNIGKYVSPTEVLFELINPDDIHLTLTVFERDLDKLFIGQKVAAYTNYQPEKKHPCEILLIGKDLSAERNTEVHCHFETFDKSLVPGTYMNAEIEVKSKKNWVLPADAIVRYGAGQYVYLVKGNNQFEMIPVSVGESENGYSAIMLNGEKTLEGKEFVNKGAYTLLMMMKNKGE